MKDLENRVLSSNTWGLVAMLHEGLIERIDEAVSMVEEGKGHEELNPLFDNIRDILSELTISFKGDTELGMSLKEIYLYVTKVLTDAFRTKDLEAFADAKNMIRPIHEAFIELSLREEPDIVSGLTYGKGDLVNSERSKLDIRK